MAGNKPAPLELNELDPSELVINGQWAEVKLKGSGFKGRVLSAFMTLPIQVAKGGKGPKPKVEQDKFIVIEQPENDVVLEKEFPIQVKVLPGASVGDRKVILAKSLDDIDEFGICKSNDCKVLDGKFSIK